MSCITIDSGPYRPSNADNHRTRQGIFASLFRAIACVIAVCRSGAALARMSERDLADLGLLPWEVGAEAEPRPSASKAPCT
jgi:uncharacterized protein YjiS (DUF1127 family)